VLRQALREGCLRPQVAFAASGLSPSSQEELAALYQREGELSTADLKRFGEGASDPDPAAAPEPATVAGGPAGAAPDRDPTAETGSREDPAARARRQAAELLRTLEQTGIADEIRQRVAEVVEQLGRIPVRELSARA
jgi:hypothetical protein